MVKREQCSWLALLATIAVLSGVVYFTRFYNIDAGREGPLPSETHSTSPESNTFNLDFFSRNFNASVDGFNCKDLFSVGTAAALFQMSNAYALYKDEFAAEVWKATKNYTISVEGNSKDIVSQYRALHYMGSSRNVRRICETGFNAGHSSFNWLTSNDRATVHSFDLGQHSYTPLMAEYLTSKFKNRLFLTIGSSVETIPKFSELNRHFRCDLIFVDGGHSYEVALADLRNFIPMTRSKRNFIIIDDYPTS